eukprot:3102908-Pyramimonas_sp.AAC.1
MGAPWSCLGAVLELTCAMCWGRLREFTQRRVSEVRADFADRRGPPSQVGGGGAPIQDIRADILLPGTRYLSWKKPQLLDEVKERCGFAKLPATTTKMELVRLLLEWKGQRLV